MKPPIFIVGANRSGTTLFRLILNRHSEIAIPDELSYFRGPFFRAGKGHWRGDQIRRDQYERFVTRFIRNTAETVHPLDADELLQNLISREHPDLRTPYEFVLSSWAAAHGKECWGEKTPGNLFHAPVIREMFPDARFVYMVRDPRAGTSSMQQASIFGEDIVINTLNRLHYMTAGLRLLENTVPEGSRYLLRYEDLITEPEQTLRSICRFLDIEFEPAMLAHHEDAEEFMKARALNDFSKTATSPIDPTRIGSWRKTMSTREIAIVEWLCREEMLRFGYPLDGARLSIVDRFSVPVRSLYWHLHMWRNRNVPQYQVRHGLFPRLTNRIVQPVQTSQ